MNRRQYFRFSVDLEVRYRILESLGPYKTTCTEDMAEGGLKINLLDYIKPETRLEITVQLPGETYPIMAIGRVVWVRKKMFSDFFNTGIQLVYIDEQDKNRFYKYAVF